MACGNNEVSRDGLSGEPNDLGHPGPPEEIIPALPKIEDDEHWYTKYDSKKDTVELLIGEDGRLTTGYPHVHVIHDDKNKKVRIHVTPSEGVHSDRVKLKGDISPSAVDAAVEERRERM